MIAIEVLLIGCLACIVVGIIVYILLTSNVKVMERPDAMEVIYKTTWEGK